MTCDEARRLISLHRSGERTEKETSALNEHLGSCATCTDVADALQPSSQAMSRLRLLEPVLRDGHHFTQQTMARIAAWKSGQQRAWIDIFFSPAERQSVRYSLAAVVLIALITLGTQTYQTMRDARAIEQKYSMESDGAGGERIRFELDVSRMQVTKREKDALRSAGLLSQANTQVLVTDRMIVLIRSVLGRPLVREMIAGILPMELDPNSFMQTLKPYVRVRPLLTPDD